MNPHDSTSPKRTDPEDDLTFFADIMLPVPLPQLFTYRVPAAFNGQVQNGQRVIVQFGDRRILTGIVAAVHNKPPTGYEAKYLLEILDTYPVVSEQQIRFFRWVADYYLCTPGEVLKAALPSGLKLSSESMVQLHPAFRYEESQYAFSDKEFLLLQLLQESPLSYTEIARRLDVRSPYSTIKSLVMKEAVLLFEEVKEKYKPQTEKRVRLKKEFLSADALETLFAGLGAFPKQEEIALQYLQQVNAIQHPEQNQAGMATKRLLAEGLSAAALKTLIRKNVFEEYLEVVSRFQDDEVPAPVKVTLSEGQLKAQRDIIRAFEKHATVLLHGVTGSGKTAIYIDLIQQALEGGSQVLFLVPEIALTTQIVQRLRVVFGTSMGVYHSRFSDNERVEVWHGVLQGRFKFVIGVRSSVFLPFDNLGLIIVDEEHDSSYKQYEPAPRYHARDAAIVLAGMHHAKVLLGSATPAVETFFQAEQGRYGMVALDQRYGDASLPDILLANLAQERKDKRMKGDFSRLLFTRIEDALRKKEQVIIFQNRRGYSPLVSCEDCGWIPKCVNCAVSLTYHQYRHALVCHYCGYRQVLPVQCPTCSSKRIKTQGSGTERLQEELKILFPEATVERMDLDTTRSKTAYETIISKFEKGETDILVGTQMVTKGLDFDRVSLVGIFNADRMMHFPDFRSYERAYQLITQVSGRAGRRAQKGTVVIQTNQPDHFLLQQILKGDFYTFYHAQLTDRKAHHYPPFTRLIEVTVKHDHQKAARETAVILTEHLRQAMPGIRILGPGEPMIAKIRNQYLMHLLIKIPRGLNDLAQLKTRLTETIDKIGKEKAHRNSRIVVDVDPM